MAGYRRLPLETLPPFKRSSADLVEDANESAETFKALLLGQNWDLLYAHHTDMAGQSAGLLTHISSLSRLEGLWGDYLSERDAGLKDAFVQLAGDSSPDGDDIRAAMLDRGHN
jgi:hypothetical protein